MPKFDKDCYARVIIAMLEQNFKCKMAWIGRDLPDDAGLILLDQKCLDEILDLASLLAANPLPILSLKLEDFVLKYSREVMQEVQNELDCGYGFAIINRLPLEEIKQVGGENTLTSVYWLLASMLARPVAQSWDGKVIYEVRDTGKQPGNGVRPDITNASQNIHTDNSYNLCPPNYVALLCRQVAKDGGISKLVSFYSAHNCMNAECPDLLARLYQDFTFDRQREHAPEEKQTIRHPLFKWENNCLVGRLSKRMVVQGYELQGEPMDKKTVTALNALETTLNRPSLAKEFHFKPGQIQFLNNRSIGHARTAFTDWSRPEQRRHLTRLWLRDQGRTFYNG